MKFVKRENINHSSPSSQGEDYPYAKSAKLFHTDQLFLYSEKVEPGKKSSAPHFHKEIDEIVFVIKGELHAYEGEETVLLKTGDSICFYANSKELHYLENLSQEDAEFLLFRKNIEKEDVEY